MKVLRLLERLTSHLTDAKLPDRIQPRPQPLGELLQTLYTPDEFTRVLARVLVADQRAELLGSIEPLASAAPSRYFDQLEGALLRRRYVDERLLHAILLSRPRSEHEVRATFRLYWPPTT